MVHSEFLHQKAAERLGYPPLPPDQVMREAAYLVGRGVRTLAILGTCATTDAMTTRHRLLANGQAGCVPFTVPVREGRVTAVGVQGERDLCGRFLEGCLFGYASHAWGVDLLRWVNRAAPVKQRDRILGLLLGYAPDAIRSFEELTERAST